MEDNSLTIDALGTSFPYVWLRDSCQSEECIHPATTQKLHQTSDVSPDIKPLIVKLQGEQGIAIEWEDGHRSVFDKEFLKRHASPAELDKFHLEVPHKFWDRESVQSDNLYLNYSEIQSSSGLLKAINQLVQYGLLFVRGVPTEQKSHEDCEVRKLVALFGDLRPTLYGEVWDVQNKNKENIAYTNLNLGFHGDLLYFVNPPRYQILHCLRNRVEGGTSVFVDAFNAAYQLKNDSPSDFDVLTKTGVPYQYVYKNYHYHQTHPTIQLSPTDPNEIRYINYGPPFQAPLLLSTPPQFYHAIRRFNDRLQEPQNAYRYRLEESDAVFFDNRRVLHARTAFEDTVPKSQGEISRWLQGCYFEGDKMWDKGRFLRARAT